MQEKGEHAEAHRFLLQAQQFVPGLLQNPAVQSLKQTPASEAHLMSSRDIILSRAEKRVDSSLKPFCEEVLAQNPNDREVRNLLVQLATMTGDNLEAQRLLGTTPPEAQKSPLVPFAKAGLLIVTFLLTCREAYLLAKEFRA